MAEQKNISQLFEETKKPTLGDKHGFPKGLTDAEYVLQLSAKPSVLPNFGGEKGVEPNQESLERTSIYYDELTGILSEDRVCRIRSLSQGRWEPSKKLITVFKAVGSFWKKFGTNLGGVLYVLPEEGLFLIEQGVFELYLNELPLSVEESWVLLFDSLPSFEYYTVFAFLCRLGFALLSSRKQEYFIDGGFISCKGTNDEYSAEDAEITPQVSQEQLGEKPFSELRSKLPSTFLKIDDTSSSQLLVERGNFDNLDWDNCNQQTPPPKVLLNDISDRTNQTTKKADRDSPWRFMEEFDKPTCESEMNNVPLVLPQDAVSLEAVMKKLRIIPGRAFGGRSRKLRSDLEDAYSPHSLNQERRSALCIPITKSPDGKKERKVIEEKCTSSDIGERNSAVEMMETSTSPRQLCNKVRQTLEKATRVPAEAVNALDKQYNEIDIFPTSGSYKVEEETDASLLPKVNDKILSKASAPSWPLSKEDFLSGGVEKSLAQGRSPVVEKSDSVAANDLVCQVSSPTSSLERAEIPRKPLLFFDVYYKTANFKKSTPGPPDCRIFPCSCNELPLDLKYFEYIFDCSRNIPVRLGLCEQGSVTFYSMIQTDVSVVLSNDKLG